MNYFKNSFGIAGVALALLVFTGCLISGTFVTIIFIVDADFTTQGQFYHYNVDLSDDSIWEDHHDKIKDIDLVGFEVWITNHESEARTFSVWIDELNEPEYSTLPQVQANATKILDNMTLGADVQTHVTYGQSFKFLMNVETLKTLVKQGAFHYYGVSDGGTSAGYTIDSAKVIITFTAGV